jgi:1-acyl-sn-glycerol-3-phosphate acyltransferase
MLNSLFILRVLFVCLFFVAPTGTITMMLPGRGRRRAFAHYCARLAFRLAGTPITVAGVANLPKKCVVVSNHASNLDGAVLLAALPPRFTFVIKRAILSCRICALFLHRIGAEFVSRFKPATAAVEARRLIRIAQNGDSLGLFPENPRDAKSGLRKFRLGAFAIAGHAGVPVVPVIIQGTGEILPCPSLRPRRRPISVRVGEPIWPDGATPADARALADRAWEYMANCVGLESSATVGTNVKERS